MNKFEKGVISVVAGMASIPLLIGMSSHAEITDAGIEACAVALPHANPNAQWLPAECYNGAQSVFPVDEASQRLMLLSADDYRHSAYELKMDEQSEALIRKLLSVAGGIAIGGYTYFETAVNTPEYRAAKQQKKLAKKTALSAGQ